MVLPIYVYGQQVLREIAKPVDPNMEGLDTLLSDMYETMKNADGVGRPVNSDIFSVNNFLRRCPSRTEISISVTIPWVPAEG